MNYDEPATGLEPHEACMCPHCRTEGLADQTEQCHYYLATPKDPDTPRFFAPA